METLVEDVKEQAPAPGRQDETPRGDEINELLRIKQAHRIEENRVPCPSCGVVVENTLNHCPFCESDITAEAALARETIRRLRELSGKLDGEHNARTKDAPKPRGFFARLKAVFAGDPPPEPVNTFKADPTAKRLLGSLAPGDAIRIVGEDGAWLQVRTPSSETGWVYSTLKKTS